MLESTKEDATGLPEGSDIGLGARCREFESPHSDQNPSKFCDFGGFFLTFMILFVQDNSGTGKGLICGRMGA